MKLLLVNFSALSQVIATIPTPHTPLAFNWNGHSSGVMLRLTANSVDNLVLEAAATPPSFWQVKLFALVLVICGLPILFHLVTHPALLRRRIHAGPLAEPEPRQKLIVSLLLLCMLAMSVVLNLDLHNGWSAVPVFIVLLGDLLVATALILIWLVFRSNPFAAATVKVELEQTVISSGPYALVRHPMYSGLALLFLGIPMAVGSWWGLVLFPLLLAVLIWRLKDEEKYLSNHLLGYQDYCVKVTHQLIPYLW
jgi:protein-S-isoprenylcysteine O-methyltransferase Ste14